MRKFDFWKTDWLLGMTVMAQLMFKIASEPPADMLAVNPSVPAGLVHRALSE